MALANITQGGALFSLAWELDYLGLNMTLSGTPSFPEQNKNKNEGNTHMISRWPEG
jgi:hypothetical protein